MKERISRFLDDHFGLVFAGALFIIGFILGLIIGIGPMKSISLGLLLVILSPLIACWIIAIKGG